MRPTIDEARLFQSLSLSGEEFGEFIDLQQNSLCIFNFGNIEKTRKGVWKGRGQSGWIDALQILPCQH